MINLTFLKFFPICGSKPYISSTNGRRTTRFQKRKRYRDNWWKKLEGQENIALGFIDLEKANNIVLREMAMATLRWMGVPEAEVMMVEGTYEETKGRVVCGLGISEEFMVDVSLRQRSGLSALLFTAVVEMIIRKTSMKDMYADDLAVVVDSETDLQEQLVEWKDIVAYVD